MSGARGVKVRRVQSLRPSTSNHRLPSAGPGRRGPRRRGRARSPHLPVVPGSVVAEKVGQPAVVGKRQLNASRLAQLPLAEGRVIVGVATRRTVGSALCSRVARRPVRPGPRAGGVRGGATVHVCGDVEALGAGRSRVAVAAVSREVGHFHGGEREWPRATAPGARSGQATKPPTRRNTGSQPTPSPLPPLQTREPAGAASHQRPAVAGARRGRVAGRGRVHRGGAAGSGRARVRKDAQRRLTALGEAPPRVGRTAGGAGCSGTRGSQRKIIAPNASERDAAPERPAAGGGPRGRGEGTGGSQPAAGRRGVGVRGPAR